ncbi:hypothetical protein [Devosia lacusdianchii]|uniref:hypothetical protein n=1 Tax=Devosia lacusdianchii TaxID=2917991 RepID=UPI001F06EF95|nr:hypothetical protein [Devosia sp. JXJ CY 41]
MLIQIGLMIGLIIFVMSFYWTRVIFGALLMLAWGLFAVGAPLYFFFDNLRTANVAAAVIVLLASAPVVFCWLIAARAARDWYQQQIKWGRFRQPWNAR